MIRFPNGYIIENDQPEDAFLVYGELNSGGAYRQGVPTRSAQSLQCRMGTEK